jgi:hypothetical protein
MSTHTNLYVNIINAPTNLTIAPVGEILLAKDPVSGMGAVTKQYVDAKIGINANPAVTVVTTPTYSVLAADYFIACRYSQIGAQQLTLPIINITTSKGKMYNVVDTSGNAYNYNITITPSGSNKINGQASVKINGNYGSLSIFSDGINWFIF